MKPKHIFLIRHFKSEANGNRGFFATVPDHEVGLLSDTGESEKTAKKLNELILSTSQPCAINLTCFVSPFKRAKQTVERITPFMKRPVQSVNRKLIEIEDVRLMEQSWGHWREKHFTDYQVKERERYGPYWYRFPKGENCLDVFNRFATFFHDACETNGDEYIWVIVAHGMLNRIAVQYLTRASVDEMISWKCPFNGSIIHLELNEQTYINRTPFLKREKDEDIG
jgi:broad specificity phosphatase PhoE